MTYSEYKELFINGASLKGLDSGFIANCLVYSDNLIKQGLPVVFSIEHLSKLVGYKKSYIIRSITVQRQKYMYRSYMIPKKNGGSREISEPLPSLKEIQYRILNNVLKKLEISKYAKAYVEKVGIKNHVRYHKGSNKVLTLDIKDFFTSISSHSIEKIFFGLGYTRVVSSIFARLCTLNSVLAQGAPCSPILSNIYLIGFDNQIASFCNEKGIKFTRYADDMAFSGDFDVEEITTFVSEKLNGLGLRLNDQKTSIMHPNQQQIISGIIINEKIQVPKKKRNQIRANMYCIKKYGLASHLQNQNISKANYVSHLLGKINYILYLNPKDAEFQEYKKHLVELLYSD